MAYVLIADDDELIAEMACDLLIDEGHACGWVTSGEEAWDLMQKRRPDILLLDQDMPGISGVSLLRKLRGSAKFYDLPVIMFTAMSGEADEDRAIYAGAQEYLRKPFTPSGLISRIDRVLAKRGDFGHLDLKTRLAREAGFLDEGSPLERRLV
ncbi:response regulator [Erythrobacter rubeus]|uniref:Response regulator n=1 Tax=Erythrobacter rubeus TaxID=2760803 RepID=A0ABR8KVG2_9SPHN|nr:response regulator [Erythrobacter rubeus]MBD2842116.1 response regulator [Erythrobacter rubeus]